MHIATSDLSSVLILSFSFVLHFCETEPLVAKFCNMGLLSSTLTNISCFLMFFFLTQDHFTLIQGPLSLSYIKQQLEKIVPK